MSKRKFLIFVSLVLTLALLSWGIGQAVAQSAKGGSSGNGNGHQNKLKDAENAAAALRKAQGLMRYTTNDDRLAAAQRNTARTAGTNQGKGKGKGKGGGK